MRKAVVQRFLAAIKIVTYEILTDGDCIWRIGARDGNIVWDHTLTDDGFDGTEDIDWYNAQSE